MELIMMSKTSFLSFVNLTVLTALFGRIISDNSFSRDNLRNIVVDEENGVLYIGGDGDLYKLHIGNLSILNSIQTCDSCYKLECKNTKGDKFNLLQHGGLIELGDKLSTSEANQALVATFAVGIDPENPWTNRSAICLYTVKEIQERIIEAQTRIVSKCDSNGKLVYDESKRYVVTYRNSVWCQNESFVKKYLNCTKENFGSYAFLTSFDVKLKSTAILTADDTLLGKVSGRRLAGGYSELLVGTDKGDIKKIAIFNNILAVQYDTFNVDSGQSVEAIHLGKNEDYFLTSKKLVKVAASYCSKYMTCDECQISNNPHCGWCILEEKCTTKMSCSTTGNNTWLPTPTKCILPDISSKAVSVNTSMVIQRVLNQEIEEGCSQLN